MSRMCRVHKIRSQYVSGCLENSHFQSGHSQSAAPEFNFSASSVTVMSDRLNFGSLGGQIPVRGPFQIPHTSRDRVFLQYF